MKFKVFVSGVQKELKVERQAIKNFILGDVLLSEYFEVFLFEDAPAKSKSAEKAYLDEVNDSDIYIGILGEKYGTTIKKAISPTEAEFEEAKKLDKNILIYIKGQSATDKNREDGVKKLLVKIRDSKKGYSYKRFNNITELIRSVYASLIDFLKKEGIVGRSAFDERICENAKLSDMDAEKVRWFLRTAKAARKYPLKEDTPIKDVFTHLDFIKNGKLTNAAILLFGKNPHKYFIQAEVKCLQFSGTEVKKPFVNYQVYSGNLFEQIDKARAFVLDAIKFPVIQKAGSARFERLYELPEFAIQEAIANAIAHRNYNNASGIQLMVFADRVEVWNSGSLPPELTVEDLKKPHTSFPSNPYIANVLYLADYAQRAGSGTIEMLAKCKEHHAPEPEFVLIRNKEFRAILPRDIFTEDSLVRIGLNERQIKAVKYVREKGRITNKEYKELTEVSKPTATRDLSELKQKKVFTLKGIGKRSLFYILYESKISQ
ncbi:MAG: DUF4062 domain-containing protein [Elusimicrobia bacterium]|nr:DUF4062 domain-containing protein [Elusimicrobiota bacterium]